MELKQLHYFLQLSKDKNFSHASKNLYLTQQARALPDAGACNIVSYSKGYSIQTIS